MRKTSILVAIIALLWAVPAIATPPPSITAEDNTACECVCIDDATALTCLGLENDREVNHKTNTSFIETLGPSLAIELTFGHINLAGIELGCSPTSLVFIHIPLALMKMGSTEVLLQLIKPMYTIFLGQRLAIDVLGQRVSFEMGLSPALIYEMGKTEVLPRQIWPNQIIITSANCAVPCDGALDTIIEA